MSTNTMSITIETQQVLSILEDNPCDHCKQAEFAGIGQQPLYYLV